jgi:hypothetical protein
MAQRAGSADLPLHGGRVPAWLGQRMTRLGAVIVEAIILEYGRDELLRRLAHPFWFQSFGCVMGMDWHSSGITTSVIGALKRGLAPLSKELGLHVCGGRGRHSRATPAELIAVGERVGLDGEALAKASRLVAKVDSAAVQDGFDLYLHAFIVADDGRWVVVQQGMSDARGQARRYHWLSEGMASFVDAPHAAIEGQGQGRIVNLTDLARPHARATAQLDHPRRHGARMPSSARCSRHRRHSRSGADRARPAAAAASRDARASRCPAGGRGRCAACTAALAAAADRAPSDFSRPAAGARCRRPHGARAGPGRRGGARRPLHRFADPARFAHGAWRQGRPSLPGAAEGL